MDNNEMNVTQVTLDVSDDIKEALANAEEPGFSKGEKITGLVLMAIGVGTLAFKLVKKCVKAIPKMTEQGAIELLEKKGYTVVAPDSDETESDEENDVESDEE